MDSSEKGSLRIEDQKKAFMLLAQSIITRPRS